MKISDLSEIKAILDSMDVLSYSLTITDKGKISVTINKPEPDKQKAGF